MAKTNTGPNSPGTTVDDDLIGTIPWSDPNNSQSSDNSYAVAVLTETGTITTHYLLATNFGFAIPDDATIDGIKVEIEAKVNSANGWIMDYIRIVKGENLGTENHTLQTYTTNDSYLGSGGDLTKWGETWTVADINSENFGVAVSTYTTDFGATISIDHIRITVYYSVSDRIDISNRSAVGSRNAVGSRSPAVSRNVV